jgi:hypothetical protein
LLAQGAASESSEPGAAHFEPPPVQELAKLFPQLEIICLLGAGGMGAVYKARQPSLDRWVALKVLPSKGAGGANFEERFNREARALARLSHPNIVTVHEFGRAGGLHYFIMEFVDGANLRQLEQGGRLSPREALQIIPQICDALQYAHDQGVVHRDIKPENVLVDRKGRVKIADFGLARILGAEAESLRLTAEGQVMGTPHYMAPEQVARPLAVDHRADIYSLGVVLYEMLTGDLPLGKFPPPSRKVQVDVRFDEVVLRALENDPERRYQRASEVKTQVETIAGTPPPTAAAQPPAPEPQFIRWAGFRLVNVRGGVRAVNWPQALFALAVVFGVLTIAFGAVTLATGRSLMGWLGVIGWESVIARSVIAGLVVLGAAWRALRSKPIENEPRTPQGTVILAPERFSRKAIVGICWAPMFLIAWLFWFISNTLVQYPADAPPPAPSTAWWQIALSVTVLPLGITAPFGTTILGWLAVGDIRRSRGRIGGLPLALFDGLFFPLVALDVLLYLGVANTIQWWAVSMAEGPLRNPPPAVVAFIALAVCAWVDFLIVRRVWRAVRLSGDTQNSSGDWWWSRTPGAIMIGLACVAILAAVAYRAKPPSGIFKRAGRSGIFEHKPNQVAAKDSATGALVATLPNGGRMELLALSDVAVASNEWWRPDGTPLAPAVYSIKTPGRLTVANTLHKDLIFRFVNLPNGATFPTIESDPSSSLSTGNTVLRDGQLIENAWPVRMAWPESVRSVNLRLGVGIPPWRTVATSDALNRNRSSSYHAGDPKWTVNFHHASERDGQAQLTVVQGLDDGLWQTQIVAVDTNGVEHTESDGTGTPAEKTATWTYTFRVPLSRVKEFRAQIRPLHWVEFRDVALQGKGLGKHSKLPQRAEPKVAVRNPQTGAWSGKLGRSTVELLAVSDGNSAPNGWWAPDGAAIPDTLFEVLHFGESFVTGRTNKDFIFRWKDLPDGASGPSLEFGEGGGGSAGGEVFRDGKLLQLAWPVIGSFLPTDTKTTARLGFGMGLWQTLSTHASDRSSSTQTLLPEYPRIDAKVHQVGERDGEAEVTMVITKPSRDWDMRVIAVDSKGAQHTYQGASGTPAEPAMLWTYTFRKLPLANVKQFELQLRPVQWIEFRDVRLQPSDRGAVGRSSRTFVPTRLGPEREVQVTEMFDFDTGKAGAFPVQKDGTKFVDGIERNSSWMMRHGYDVDAGTDGLRVLQMSIVDLKSNEWDTVTPGQLDRLLRTQIYGPPLLPTPAAALPATHGFRTKTDGMGILQITSLDKSAVTLRYKLIERAHLE